MASIRNGLSEAAKYLRMLGSRTAPRLSAFETNAYLMPSLMSLSSHPEPAMAA